MCGGCSIENNGLIARVGGDVDGDAEMTYKEILAAMEDLRRKYDEETEANGLLAKRRKLAAIVESGDVGEAPEGFPDEKECKCGAVYPRTDLFFNNSTATADRLDNRCRVCFCKLSKCYSRPEYKRLAKMKREKINNFDDIKEELADILASGDFGDVPAGFPEKKKCKCGRTFPRTSKFFSAAKRRDKDGLHGDCRICVRIYNREYSTGEKREEKRKKREEKAKANAAANVDGLTQDCSNCGKTKPLDENNFGLWKSRTTGEPYWNDECRDCFNEYIRKIQSEEYKAQRAIELEELWRANAAKNPELLLQACIKCGNVKLQDANHFRQNKDNEDELEEICKSCFTEIGRFKKSKEYKNQRERERLDTWLRNADENPLGLKRDCNTCFIPKYLDANNFIREKDDYTVKCKNCFNEHARYRKSDEYRKLKEYEAELAKQGKQICTKRGCIKDLSEFPKNKKAANGHGSWCNDCCQELSNKNDRKRMRTDPTYRAYRLLKSGLSGGLKKKNHRKESRTKDVVQCEWEFLVEHLEKYGFKVLDENIQIDHRVPVAWARTPEEVEILFHWSNLHLMPGEENNLKRDRPLLEENLPPELIPEIKAIYRREIEALGDDADYYEG